MMSNGPELEKKGKMKKQLEHFLYIAFQSILKYNTHRKEVNFVRDSMNSVMRAYLDAVILARLQKGDTYGYAVIKEVEQASAGACCLQEGPLYIEFRRMEKEGWIRSYWGDETKGARRRYYAITEAGASCLEDRKKEWDQMKKIMKTLLENSQAEGEVLYE